MMAPLKNNCFEIVLFSFWTLKTASQKQHYLCQKFLLPIPKQTWKIFSIERLIYFLRPHMAIWSRLTPTNVAKRCVSRNSVYHYFLLLLCSHLIQGAWKKSICSPIRRNCWKKNIHSAIRLYLSKINCICSAVRPCCSKKIYIRSAVRKKIASVQPLNRSVLNGFSSHFLSVHLPCIQPLERIS